MPQAAPEPLRPRPAYGGLDRYVAPARGSAELWRILAVLGLGLLFQDLTRQVIFQTILAWKGPVFGAMWLANLTFGASPSGVVLNLILAVPMAAAFVLAVALVTGRGLPSLMGAGVLRGMLAGFVPLMGLGLGLWAILPADPALVAGQGLGSVLTWAPLALPGVFATALASEIVFRGFLLQQLAARYRASWVWMGLPAALFALIQGAPPAIGDMAALSLVWSLCFSAAAADLTARTGGLGAALGLQAGLLAQAVLVTGLRGPMNGLALSVLDVAGPAALPWIALDFLMLAVGWLSARVWLRV